MGAVVLSWLCAVFLQADAGVVPENASPVVRDSVVRTVTIRAPYGAGRDSHNALADSSMANSPDVLAAIECALRYGLAGSPPETICFVAFGRDSAGAWLDPPEALLDRMVDLPLALEPVSTAGLNPVPPCRGGAVVAVEQPQIPAAKCSVELVEWEPGARAVISVGVLVRGGSTGSTAVLRKVEGEWVLEEWRGHRAWSPN